MPLFQCSRCGAADNSALTNAWEALRSGAPPLCSACDPAIGKWHGEFTRRPALEAEKGCPEAWARSPFGAPRNRPTIESFAISAVPVRIMVGARAAALLDLLADVQRGGRGLREVPVNPVWALCFEALGVSLRRKHGDDLSAAVFDLSPRRPVVVCSRSRRSERTSS